MDLRKTGEKYCSVGAQVRGITTALLNNVQAIQLILCMCNSKILVILTLPKKIFNAFIDVCHPLLLLS